MKVRPRAAENNEEVESFLDAHGSLRVARLGELLTAMDHPALIAQEGGRIVGVLTYVVRGEAFEVLTLHASGQWRGVGTALMTAAENVARSAGCSRLWLITTNDNVDALRFYQRRGLRLAALHREAVDHSRAQLKPEISATGEYGIPLRDELELEKNL